MAAARATGVVVVVLLLAFLTLPSVVVIVVSFNPTTIMAFPPHGLSLRWYENALTYPQFQRAALNSLIVTAAATLLALPIGTAAALALVRHRVAARAVWAAALLSPLVVPGVAAGLGFLILAAGLGLLASRWVLIAVHAILVLPFVIRSVSVSVANLDPALERAAASLGARPSRVFRRVTLPLLRPGLFAAILFAVIVSVNEFVVSLFVSTRVTEILPVAMFTYVVNYTDPTMAALSTLFIAATFVAVFAGERRQAGGGAGRRPQGLRRDGGHGRRRPRDRRGRAADAARALGLRQDDHAQRHRRLRRARHRARAHRRCGGDRQARLAAWARHRLPVLRAVSAHERCRQRRLRSARARGRPGGGRRSRARGPRARSAAGRRRPAPRAALRRPAAARGPGARARDPPARAAARRAAGRAGPQAARGDARRAEGDPARGGDDDGVRHPRPA